MAETVDVAIIGGGIAGASVAYFLARLGVRNVLVLERSAVAGGASGRASGLVSMLTTGHPGCAALLKASADFYASWEREIDSAPAVTWVGGLRPVPEAERADLQGEVRIMRDAGHEVEILERPAIEALVPDWDLAAVGLAAYSPRAGYIDPPAVTTALMNRARAIGVRVYQGAGVEEVLSRGGRVAGVRTTRGEIRTGTVIAATGAWLNGPWMPEGLRSALQPVRHMVAHLLPPPSLRWPFPVTGDLLNAVYSRPEPGGLVLAAHSGVDEPAPDSEGFEPGADDGYARDILVRLARRIPAMRAAEIVGGHAGVYLAGSDEFPIVGRLGDMDGLYCLADTAGNGMTSSPGLARALAETIVRGQTFTDIAPFRPGRFAEGRPIQAAYRHAGEPLAAPR